MGSNESRSYSDAHHIWGWSERLTQWCDSDPEPGADADLIFQPCREAEKALGNCEQHQAHIVQRHLDSCENTYEAFLNDGRSDQWADFLRAASLLGDKLQWLADKLQPEDCENAPEGRDESGLQAGGKSECCAPQFKNNPPTDPEILGFLKSFQRSWEPDRNTTAFCKEYAAKHHQSDKRAAKRLRSYVYRYLTSRK